MLNTIKNNSELVVGKYYHCFDKRSGNHSIHRCYGHPDDIKYIGSNSIWADDTNNQALERWVMMEVKIPSLNTVHLCSKHHGSGFISDCSICKNI